MSLYIFDDTKLVQSIPSSVHTASFLPKTFSLSNFSSEEQRISVPLHKGFLFIQPSRIICAYKDSGSSYIDYVDQFNEYKTKKISTPLTKVYEKLNPENYYQCKQFFANYQYLEQFQKDPSSNSESYRKKSTKYDKYFIMANNNKLKLPYNYNEENELLQKVNNESFMSKSIDIN